MSNTEQTDPTPCEHTRTLEDKFSKLPGVKRSTPGDVVCADCGACLPYSWNRGKPIPLTTDRP